MIAWGATETEVGRYLAHSLWQGPVLLLAYLALRRWVTAARPEVSCRAAGSTVVLLALLPLLTGIIALAASRLVSRPAEVVAQPPGLIPVPGPMLLLLQRHLTLDLAQALVLVWVVGVALSLTGIVVGLWRLDRILARAGKPVALSNIEALAHRAGLERIPEVREWTGARAPFVAGWFRPIVVLPSGLRSLLSQGELEAVLLHELAHVKRNDLRNNLVLRLIASLAWYQLPLWKLMGDLARDREFCCDELTVRTMGRSLPLATALITLAERRSAQPRLVMAGTGGDFASRVRRIVSGEPSVSRSLPRGASLVLAGFLAVAASTLLMAGSAEGQLTQWAENLHAKIRASDPRGPFTVELIGRRLVSATIGGEVVPSERIVQHGEQVQMLDRDGHPELTLEIRAPGIIRWNPRPPPGP